jgi:signal transduction histidine kinase/ligand-binding sensor domain-containing protein
MRIARFRSRTEAFITRRFWTSTRLAGRKLAGHARRLCVIALLGAVSPGWALDPDRFLTEYHRAVFTARDGAPQSVWSFAQGPDGLLWIGSGGGGIHRFDGHSFEPIPQLGDEDIRQRTVTALHADAKGGMWIGYGGFGAGHVDRDGRYTRFGNEQGWRTTRLIGTDPDGPVWVIEGERLARVVDGKKEPAGAGWGLDGDARPHTFVFDRQGTMWLSMQNKGIFYRPRGAKRFEPVELPVRGAGLAVAADGSIWVAKAEGGVNAIHLKDGRPDRLTTVSDDSLGLLFVDRDGGLWSKSGDALLHHGRPGRLVQGDPRAPAWNQDVLDARQAFGTSEMLSIFEDAQSNIWIGTARGIVRLRNSLFIPRPLPIPDVGYGVAVGDNDTVWAVNWRSPLYEVKGRDLKAHPEVGLASLSITADKRHGIWVGGQRHLTHTADARVFKEPDVPDDVVGRIFRSLTVDAQGTLWTATHAPGPAGRVIAGKWSAVTGLPGLPDNFDASRVHADAQGRVWLSGKNRLYVVQDGHARLLSDDLIKAGTGSLFAQSPDRDGVWLAGSLGVALHDGTGFRKLLVAGTQPVAEISGVVMRRNGDLWLHSGAHAILIPGGEIARWRESPSTKVAATRFDTLDGLLGWSPTSSIKPTLAEASDGRLWFSTNEGLASVDPDAVKLPDFKPRTLLRQLTADGQTLPLSLPLTGPLSLAPRLKQLEIAYTAASLAYPERTRFRYRLDGLDDPDDEWQEVDGRRSAFYTNLPPGQYRFRAMASTQPGRWDAPEATIDFDVQPAWFQTWWFRGLCGLLALSLAAVLYRLRVRHVEGLLRLQLQARQSERERLARQLHDTLLQTIHVVIWRIHAVAGRFSSEDPVGAQLHSTLTLAEKGLAEGRRRLVELRASAAPELDLAQALSKAIEEFRGDQDVAVDIQVTGTPKPLGATIAEDVEAIVREAVANACRHARARRIDVALQWSGAALTATIRDDGIGIEADVVAQGRPGHYGIAGMRERAQQIRAIVDVAPRPEGGTVVTLRVDLAAAPVPD